MRSQRLHGTMALRLPVLLVAITIGLAGSLLLVPDASASSCTGIQSGTRCTGECTGYSDCAGVCNGDNGYCFGVCLDSYADCHAYVGEKCSPNNDFTPKLCPFCCSFSWEPPVTTRTLLVN